MAENGDASLFAGELAGFEAGFKGLPVLVTGHTGFTGGWLSLWLSGLGAKLSGLSRVPETDPSLFEAAGVGGLLSSTVGDIRDFATVQSVFETARPAVVFHLAAQPIVSQGFADPLETFETNIIGTANILEAARMSPGVKAVVNITTDKVYRDQNWAWAYRESDELGGKDPYSASKAAAELVAAAYQQTMAARGNGVAIGVARGGNIIGGGDWARDRIVPDFVRAHVGGAGLELRNPAAVRPWQHVLALCHGYLALADKLVREPETAIGAWNFGPADGDVKSVGELVKALSGVWPGPEVSYGTGTFPETHLLRVDSSNSRAGLNWAPAFRFADTVALTADWYRRYYADPASAREITLAQIDAYRRRVLGEGG